MMPPDPNTTLERCQYGWEFQFKDIPYPTVVTDRGWVCEYAGNVPTAQTIFFVGSLLGTLFFGWLADRFGRVPALVGSNLIACIGGVATVFTNGFWDFAFCRFLVGLSLDSGFMIMYIMVLEYVGIRHRTWVANGSLAIYFGVSSMLMPWVAIAIGDWQKFALLTSLPMLITLGVPFVIPESTRWLASKDKGDKAVKIFKRIAKVNGNKVPGHVMNNFLQSLRQPKTSDESIAALFNSRELLKTMIAAIVAYMSATMVFDGLVRLSEHLGLDFFLIFTLSSATEIPALLTLAFVLDRWGRRVLACGPIVLAGILNVAAAFLAKGVLQVVLTLVARFFVNMSLSALVQWVTEILPTPVRATGSSILHVSGFFGGMFSPFVVYAGLYWTPFPLLLFGILAFIACAMSLLLPETMGLPLPQTITEGERLIQEKSLFRRNPDPTTAVYNEESTNEKIVL
ncbi:solute carrier family 22 member 3-like isoform X2 [Hyposmocoma kahamanoa]|nr:solute carrier family 22 member 3-like isoform X2 [Hyposmocoma kahamanoa]